MLAVTRERLYVMMDMKQMVLLNNIVLAMDNGLHIFRNVKVSNDMLTMHIQTVIPLYNFLYYRNMQSNCY